MEPHRSSDTIDLSVLWIQLLQKIAENFRTIWATTLITLALSAFYWWASPRTYESTMIIQSDILSESYSLKIAESLNDHIQSKDYDYLASVLLLTAEESTILKEFRITSALTPTSQQMIETEKVIVVISVKVSDNAILPKLQKGIVNYLTSNEYIKRRVDARRERWQSVVAALDIEIKKLDTLKNRISSGNFSMGKIGNVGLLDVAGLYEVAGTLHEKKLTAGYELAIVDSIQIIQGLNAFQKPVWPRGSFILAGSLLVALIVIIGLISFQTVFEHFKSVPPKS